MNQYVLLFGLLVASLPLVGCGEPLCGAGTVETAGECVADCGEGTVLVDEQCVPDNCGPGTNQVDSECRSTNLQYVSIPVPAGDDVTFGQTFHGFFSHRGANVYAVDMPMPLESVVVAARGGKVQHLRSDSTTGCETEDCAGDANFVVIDHGDGTFGSYSHLAPDGVLVEVGDDVCEGEAIAESGMTGWSTGPHLHFEVDDPFRLTLPVRFWELLDDSAGIPSAGLEVESRNEHQEDCAPTGWSECPSELWMHLGVELDPGVPCSAAEYDRSYSISGRVTSGNHVRIATYRADEATGEFGYFGECIEADSSGRFEAILEFPRILHGGTTAVAFASGESGAGCQAFQGFAYANVIHLFEDL